MRAWRARAGYGSVYEFSDLKNFEQQVGAILAEPGPVFVALKIEPAARRSATTAASTAPKCARPSRTPSIAINQ